MAEVFLHVYDVTGMNSKTNIAVVQLNKLMRNGMGIGGVFHGGIQVYEKEWGFGFCEHGTGVDSGPPQETPMYTYRESVPLGRTTLSRPAVNQILTDMKKEWQGKTYNLLSRNCNHFCEELCASLGVQKPPLWVNRFAKIGDATVKAVGNTLDGLKRVTGRVTYRYLLRPFMCCYQTKPDRIESHDVLPRA